MLKLLNITLVCIDCVNHSSAIQALYKSTEQIEFGNVLFISDKLLLSNKFETVIIAKINSKEEYSKFMITKLNEYIKTDFCLVIQYDGYVINPELWNDEFLNYDYIGAPWWHEEYNVGNGGFSLRSKKLMNIINEFSLNNYNEIIHPEDGYICRILRTQIEDFVNFAPESLAKQFSYEPNQKYPDFLNNSFGFHGIPGFILK